MDSPWPQLLKVHTIAFDFDGVFTDNGVSVDENGRETVRCNRGDGLGIALLRRWKERHHPALEIFILSTEENPVVAARAKKMRIDYHQNIRDKLHWMSQHLEGRGEEASGIFDGLVYLGNDINDLSLMKRSGFSVAPNDAHPRTKNQASVVLKTNGGHGFVREFVEKILRLDSFTEGEIDELVSYR